MSTIQTENLRECYLPVNESNDVDFCFKVKGDGMTGARIHDGDIVFIHEQETVENGEIAAVSIDGEATLKRVYYYPDSNKLVLQSDNPCYEPLIYVGEEINDVKILGKAILFQSYLR